jgi:ATP-dependent helicase/nuclease subunit B
MTESPAPMSSTEAWRPTQAWSKLIAHWPANTVVVTPNRRLAQSLKRAYDHAQQAAGRLAWAAPDILPLATFTGRTYHALSLQASADSGATARQQQLIDALQSHVLWEQVIRKSEASNTLLSIPQTAKHAASAWSVAHQWRLFDAMRGYPLHEDAQMFFDWARQFQQLCVENSVVDHAVLPDVLANLLSNTLTADERAQAIAAGTLPTQLWTAGFDIVAPQTEALLAAHATAGIVVGELQDDLSEEAAHLQRHEFVSEAEELRACAAWARLMAEGALGSNHQTRIAIVVPDLQNKRSRIARALTDALDPLARTRAATLAKGGADAQSNHFNISLGLALNEYGVVHDALELIEFAQSRSLPFARVSTLLRSPFVGGAEREMSTRAKLDAELRETLSADVSLLTLQKALKLTQRKRLQAAARACPTLLEVVDRVAALQSGTQKRSPHDWRQHFSAVLSAWGFPGERALGSIEFQVLQKFRDALEGLAALESIQPRMRADEALAQLRRIVSDTVFQPESTEQGQASIQVLGILESAGQSFDPFDAMWVTGLSDDAWPLAARPNPLIPAALQRRAGVTEASAAASLALDRRITDGWRLSARSLVVSHAQFAEDDKGQEQARAVSALVEDIALKTAPQATANFAETLCAASGAARASIVREAIPDMPLASLPPVTTVAGGSSIIRDQAACPFRAFARHRLAAKPLAEPAVGLDAATRGVLLHRVLSLVWTKLTSQASLFAMAPDALAALVADAAQQAVSEARADGADMLVGRFAELEHDRLCQVVSAWLEVERERSPFEVVACEEARDVEMAGLAMQLRLDRLDRFADGTYALIDYKTGSAQLNSWLGDRPDEPQLPLYLYTADQNVSALAFARLKRGKTFGFEGVSATDGLLPRVTPIEQKRGMEARGLVSWDALVEQWQAALDQIATQFVHGVVAVDPKNGGLTCTQCDLQSMCRVAELTGHAPTVDDADDAQGANDE